MLNLHPGEPSSNIASSDQLDLRTKLLKNHTISTGIHWCTSQLISGSPKGEDNYCNYCKADRTAKKGNFIAQYFRDCKS